MGTRLQAPSGVTRLPAHCCTVKPSVKGKDVVWGLGAKVRGLHQSARTPGNTGAVHPDCRFCLHSVPTATRPDTWGDSALGDLWLLSAQGGCSQFLLFTLQLLASLELLLVHPQSDSSQEWSVGDSSVCGREVPFDGNQCRSHQHHTPRHTLSHSCSHTHGLMHSAQLGRPRPVSTGTPGYPACGRFKSHRGGLLWPLSHRMTWS